jgi:hypothetical protein
MPGLRRKPRLPVGVGGGTLEIVPATTAPLPPTSPLLTDERHRPYFLWWTDATVGELREYLRSNDAERRAYWLGALLREANTRDVWLFVTPEDIRRDWPRLQRHLGRSREMWAFLLELPASPWPPLEASTRASARAHAFLRACRQAVPFHLGGGAALAGRHLHHRLSADVDLFVHDRSAHRELVRALPDAAARTGLALEIVRDAGTFTRSRLSADGLALEVDVVFDSVTDAAAPDEVDGILVEALVDLRANKLTCLLSRSEPRDLVDLMFLDRAGYPPEDDLAIAAQKDTGLDPGVLAWLLAQFPVAPLPVMLQMLTSDQLRAFRDELCERFRAAAVPSAAR